jgi:hypothetical protein
VSINAELITVRGDEVKKRPVFWIWPKRFPAGAGCLLGEGGIGKGLLTAHITAQITKGRPISVDCPDVPPVDGEVLVISSEDSTDSVLAPRFEAAGADMSKVYFAKDVKILGGPTAQEKFIDIEAHVELIEDFLKEHPNTRLVVIDPVTNHLNSGTNPNADIEVRKALNPLNKLREKYNALILIVFHPNKKEDLSSKNRAPGAGAWINLPRASWLLAVDPKDADRRLFVALKYNYIKRGEGSLAFRIAEKAIQCDEKSVSTPFVVWDGSTSLTSDELMDKKRNRISKHDKAMKFLRELLDSGPMKQSELLDRADRQGIKKGTLEKAKLDARVTSEKQGKGWVWRLLTAAEEDEEGSDDD